MHTYIHAYMHTHKYAYVHTHIHTYIHIYIHKYLYMNMRTDVFGPDNALQWSILFQQVKYRFGKKEIQKH